MDILIARHGDTEIPGYCRGRRTDCRLSPKGERQTEANVDIFHEEGVRIVYTSSLLRAKHAGVLATQRGLEHVVDPDLDAIDAGAWEGRSWQDIQAVWPEELRLCDADADGLIIPDGTESVLAFRNRVLAALARIVDRHRKQHAALGGVVTHGCVLGVLRGMLSPDRRTALRDKAVPTGALFRLEVDDATSAPLSLRPYTQVPAPV